MSAPCRSYVGVFLPAVFTLTFVLLAAGEVAVGAPERVRRLTDTELSDELRPASPTLGRANLPTLPKDL